MEYLKLCFVFSCWMKFASSVYSTDAPEAPAHIPKGNDRTIVRGSLQTFEHYVLSQYKQATVDLTLIQQFIVTLLLRASFQTCHDNNAYRSVIEDVIF